MRKANRTTKGLQVESTGQVSGTKIYYVKLRDGSVYYRQRDIVRPTSERYPGEFRNTVNILSTNLYNHMEFKLHYVRIWFNGNVYINAEDVRNYIIIRQGHLENKRILHSKGLPYWSVEAAAAIKKLFGLTVSTNGRRQRSIIPEDIALKYENNIKLRSVFHAWNAMVRGQRKVRELAKEFAEVAALDDQLQEWANFLEENQ